ncbi:TetR/AcrR family transcriptional regulator [Sedimentibacter sp. MB35-C1]|uniref:TetR/AcrR family transcriptional regulator n=1 Tax=Sedimentibacter sp. MB35-C1 TaxID=3070995 RepID=UPI0027E1D552|nr:TetR/AcrR family transcriptional regulator [Sedimentibacter sp. MB35-C1]WMJ77776.1 TetR/AcrR family transcriptional regulator [Sedimentibacter sp. MB35-C1]
MNSRSIQAKKTKEKIYNISIKLFKSKGFDNVTIQDIAKAANVSVGLFYNYYKSKNDILLQQYVKADEIFNEFVSNGIKGCTSKEKIKNYMLFYIEFVEEQPFDFIKILYNNSNTLFIKEGRAMQTLLNPIIEEAIDAGEITVPMKVNEINEYLYQGMRGLIFHWCLYNGSFDIYKRAEKYLDLMIKAL